MILLALLSATYIGPYGGDQLAAAFVIVAILPSCLR
jgi:hypothetical protein